MHVVKEPADRLYETVRDRLPEIAAMMDDVESVRVLERKQQTKGRLLLVNEWRARLRLPALLEGLLEAGSLGWIDRAQWDDADRSCRWAIEPLFLPGQVSCAGRSHYEPAMGGRGARVTFEGEIAIALERLSTLAGPLEPAVAGLAESIVTTVIPRNFRKILDAACTLLGPDPNLTQEHAVVESEPRIRQGREVPHVLV